MQQDLEKFKEALEKGHTFPGEYLFKFIFPASKEKEVRALFSGEVTVRPSSQGKYLSLTAKAFVQSSSEVISVYQKAYDIGGVISL